MEIIDAVQYLKNNKFTDNISYSWINSILKKAMDNILTVDDVDKLIAQVLKKKVTANSKEVEESAVVTTEIDNKKKLEVSQICEICEVNNFGLLNIKEPIKLKDGLNVFYGINGVGKSSIYKAICGALGNNKLSKYLPNVDSSNKTMISKIKVKDKGGSETTLEYKKSIEDIELDVRVFDSLISNFIVSSEQDNEFEVPFLKTEYFYVLRDLLESISEKLSSGRTEIWDRTNEIRELFKERLDFINLDYKSIEKNIKEAKFDEKDKEHLSNFINDKGLLQTDITKHILKTYNDRTSDIEKILNKLCKLDDNKQYIPKYDNTFIEEYQNILLDYDKYQVLYECGNTENLSDYINSSWITDKLWLKFVETGLNFVSSLEESEKQIYTGMKCPYCNQELNEKASALFKAYANIKNSCKVDMDNQQKKIDVFKAEIADIIEFISDIEKLNVNINEAIKEIDDKSVINIALNEIRGYFECLNKALELHDSNIDTSNIQDYLYAINIYNTARNAISEKAAEISKSISDKGKAIEELNNKIKPLERNHAILQNATLLNELVEKLRHIDEIDTKRNNVTAIKKNLTLLQNNFSKESLLAIFIEQLYKEYENLDLVPPKNLEIKPNKDKRVCRIGNYKVSDIYSEGELKIHSLAEFFAKSKVDNFKGVYIFDDPVTSLDYERIEYVRERILDLINEGNQVLVFTHNIYFLYSLIDYANSKAVNEVSKSGDSVVIIGNVIFGDNEISKKKEKIDEKIKKLAKNKEVGMDIEISELSTVYDLMSGCLESFVENKLLKGIIGRYRPNIRMDSLAKLKDIDQELLDAVHFLYKKTSRYGNRHSQPKEASPPKYETLVEHYKEFVSIIKNAK